MLLEQIENIDDEIKLTESTLIARAARHSRNPGGFLLMSVFKDSQQEAFRDLILTELKARREALVHQVIVALRPSTTN